MESRTQWRGTADTSRGRLLRLVAVSVLLHVPLTPLAALAGLVGLLAPPAADEGPRPDPITAIPVDLVAVPAPAPETAQPEAEKPGANPDEKPAGEDPFKELEKQSEESPPEEPAQEQPKPAADAGLEAGAPIPDPVAMAGTAGKIADANANVRILIFNDRIRNHPLGVRIGKLLGLAEQWKDFFGPTGLDPIKDVDRVLIAGPQLRDSSEVVAVLRVNAPADRVKAALDALVKRDPQGGWLDAGVPAAHAKADRAERIFVMPSPRIVIVAPPSAEKHALSLGSGLRFPNPQGSEALTTYVITPHRAFKGIPFRVPESIKWVRMKITATSDGGAVAVLEAEDNDPTDAALHARELSDAINAITQINLGKKGLLGKVGSMLTGKNELRLIEPVAFTAEGKMIRGVVTATPDQLHPLLEAISDYAEELAREAEAKKKARAAADAGAAEAAAPSTAPPDASATNK